MVPLLTLVSKFLEFLQINKIPSQGNLISKLKENPIRSWLTRQYVRFSVWLLDVQLHAEKENDEVYAQVTLFPQPKLKEGDLEGKEDEEEEDQGR